MIIGIQVRIERKKAMQTVDISALTNAELDALIASKTAAGEDMGAWVKLLVVFIREQ